MEKRGTTHIEMVLAFILFIGAIAIVFYIFNPLGEKNLATYADLPVLDSILKEATTNMTIITIVIKDALPSGVPNKGIIELNLSGIVPFDLADTSTNKKKAFSLKIENASGETLPTGFFYDIKSEDSKHRWSLLVNWSKESGRLLILKITNDTLAFDDRGIIKKIDFPVNLNSNGNDDFVNDDLYKIASIRTVFAISENKTLALKKKYDEDYASLKSQLKLPPGIDFSFTLSTKDLNIQALKEIPIGIPVSAESRIVEFITAEGNLTYADAGAKSW